MIVAARESWVVDYDVPRVRAFAQQTNNTSGPSLWDRINPFSEHNLKLKHAELQKYCEPNCTNTITPEMAENFSKLTGTLGAAGMGRLPSTAGSLTVTKPNIGIDGKAACLVASACLLTNSPVKDTIIFKPSPRVVNDIRRIERIQRKSSLEDIGTP